MTLRSYSLKIFANSGKKAKILRLIEEWQDLVQQYIDLYWKLDEIQGAYPDNCLMPKGTIQRIAAVKAWQIVKGARSLEQRRPIFEAQEIDVTQNNYVTGCLSTVLFDFWFRVSTLEKGFPIWLPCKKHGPFNCALLRGILRKSAKIFVRNNTLFLKVYVQISETLSQSSNRLLGVDIGLKNTIVTSEGDFYGQAVSGIRQRTKHRKYLKGYSAQKQAWFREAKLLHSSHPETDFAVEDLLFKGKRKRPKSFRRRYNTWAYKTLAKRLQELGCTEGFKVIPVPAAYTSQDCPSCGHRDKGNRRGEDFRCLQCGYANHADIVGATNIRNRADRVPRVLSTRKEAALTGCI